MATTEQDETAERTNKLIESVRNAEDSALEAVREFLDTVNGVFPDVNAEDGPRRKIIDSAFKMTEQLVGASTQLAEKVVKVASSAPKSARGSSKWEPLNAPDMTGSREESGRWHRVERCPRRIPASAVLQRDYGCPGMDRRDP